MAVNTHEIDYTKYKSYEDYLRSSKTPQEFWNATQLPAWARANFFTPEQYTQYQTEQKLAKIEELMSGIQQKGLDPIYNTGNPTLQIPTFQEAMQNVRKLPEFKELQKIVGGMDATEALNNARGLVRQYYQTYNNEIKKLRQTPIPATQPYAQLPGQAAITSQADLDRYLQQYNVGGQFQLPALPGAPGMPSLPSYGGGGGGTALPGAPGAPSLPGAPGVPVLPGAPSFTTLESDANFMMATKPMVQAAMKAMGRSGMPSSSYSDRVMSDMIASKYADYQDELARILLERYNIQQQGALGVGQLAQQQYATGVQGALGLGDIAARNYATQTSGAVGMAGVDAQRYNTAMQGALGLGEIAARNYATQMQGTLGLGQLGLQGRELDLNAAQAAINAALQRSQLEMQNTLGYGQLQTQRTQAMNQDLLNRAAMELQRNTSAANLALQAGQSKSAALPNLTQAVMYPDIQKYTAALNYTTAMQPWFNAQYLPFTTAYGTLTSPIGI